MHINVRSQAGPTGQGVVNEVDDAHIHGFRQRNLLVPDGLQICAKVIEFGHSVGSRALRGFGTLISVNMVAADVYEVVVGQRVGSQLQQGEIAITEETVHRVHMSQAYYRRLCGATTTHEWVLLNAFQFLLEREPNTAILKAFDLPDIANYFPEFEAEMHQRLAYLGT